jgi:hypothetical protein
MPQGSKQVPEEFNPWVGKAYGNILDEYSSSTYNLKLYLINPDTAPPSDADESSGTSREDSGPPGNSGTTFTSTPEQTVVIAQTGVTAGNTIDDLSITTIGSVATTMASMTITQSNRADLLDQIVLARRYLGSENSNDLTFYLEITFVGYVDEDDFTSPADIEVGGQFAEIIGPFRWKLNIETIACTMNESGASYDFTFRAQEMEAYVDRRYRLGQGITARGKTITEMVKSVEDGLNKFIQSNTDKQIKDEVSFDLSGLIAADDTTSDPNKILITDENLILPNADTGDDTKAPLNKADATSEKTAEQRIAESSDPNADPEAVTEGDVTNVINFQIGESMEDIMYKILAMNPEARFRHSRKENPDEIDDQSCRKDQAFVQRLKINAGLSEKGVDKRTNQTAYKIIYRPVLYRTATTAQFVIPEENDDLSPEEINSRFRQIVDSGNMRKAYQYLFTGQNDKIINLDITYNNGVAVIMTPKRGEVGTTDAATAKEKTDTVDADEDTSSSGLLDALKDGFDALAKDTLKNLLNGDYSGIQGGVDSFTDTLSQQGFSVDELNQLEQAVATNAQNEIDQFLESIDSATLRNLATNLTINPKNPTSQEPPEYSPEQSGFKYAEDFIGLPDGTGIDVSDLESFGYSVLNSGVQSQLSTVTKETDVPIANPVEGVTVDHRTPQAASLFGQVINQKVSEDFMTSLSMTIRGDPWYLGYETSESNNDQSGQSSSDSNESSTPAAANYGTDDNYIFLEIAAPRLWDVDYRDEDSLLNTGYWMNTNTSYEFTGVYKLTKAIHNFSGGTYTVDVEGTKIHELHPGAITPQQPGDNDNGGDT